MNKVNKDEAVRLRIAGHSYPEIASMLSCSVAWCKKNLSEVKQDNADFNMIEAINNIGISPCGITYLEMRNIIKSYHPDIDNEALGIRCNKLRKALKAKNKEFLIRPVWMLPDSANDCTNALMDMSQDVYETIQNLAKKYVKLYNLDSYAIESVAYELSLLSSPASTKMMQRGLITRGRELETIIEQLDERNNK